METDSTSLLQVRAASANSPNHDADALRGLCVVEVASSMLTSLQSDIIVFLLAVLTFLLCSEARRTSRARKFSVNRFRAKSTKLRESVAGTPSDALVALEIPSSVQEAGTLAKELHRQLQDTTAAVTEKSIAALLEKTPITAELLAATRQVLSEHNIRPEGPLQELLLREHLALHAFAGFDELLAGVESPSKSIQELSVKAAAKRNDFERALRHLENLCSTQSSVAQCLIQQVVRLAAQKAALPRLLPVLRGQRLTCETLNVLLSACAQRGDMASFRTAEQLGRDASVHFNTVTYCLLLSSACSRQDADRFLSEAMLGGVATTGVLEKAAELAVERGSLMLASIVLKYLPSCRLEFETRHLGAAAALLRVPVASAVREGRSVHTADAAVLELYEKHFAGLAFSSYPDAEQIVVDVALRCNRFDIISQVFAAATSHSQRVDILRRVCSTNRLNDALSILDACPKTAHNKYNALLDACVACRDMKAADIVVQEAVKSGGADVVTYNTLIMARLQTGRIEMAHDALREMRSVGLHPNRVTFNELLDATVKAGAVSRWTVFEEMRACGIGPNMITASILLKCLQKGTPAADIERTLAIVEELEDDVDEVLLSSLVEACVRTERTDLLEAQLRKHWNSGRVVVSNAHTYGSIIRAHGALQDLRGIWATWEEMRRCNVFPTSITLGCMTEALSTSGNVGAAHDLVQDMLKGTQTRPLVNAVIYCSVLKGFARKKQFDRTWRVYEEMLEERIQMSTVTFNALVDACARCGEMGRVAEILDKMMQLGTEPNLVTYSTVVKGYCQEDKLDKAMEVMENMQRTTRYKPDEIMYNSLLVGCARKALYKRGLEILADMEAAGIHPSNFTLSVLVKLAGRGRHLDRAFSLCAELPRRYKFRPNVHVYGNLVQACVSMRALPRALSVLVKMVRARVRPDVRTCTVLLRALVAGNETEVKDAAGLLRATMGLKDARPASLAKAPIAALQPIDGRLPMAIITEVLEAVASIDNDMAADLARDLEQVARVKVDSKLKLRLVSQAARSCSQEWTSFSAHR